VGGAAIECNRALSVGERLEFYVELPNGFAVDALAEVVRSDNNQAGLRFIKMEKRALLALQSLCRPNARRA
jgi:hypothetical protein